MSNMPSSHSGCCSGSEKPTGYTGGAVDKDKDHAAKGPGYAENANAAARVGVLGGVRLALVTNHRQDGNVKEEEGGNELRNQRPVKGPLRQLHWVYQRRRWRIVVVLERETAQ
ncbi:hypothetical protein U1Q18_007610 [Sarracenia purpurea var. burkii]